MAFAGVRSKAVVLLLLIRCWLLLPLWDSVIVLCTVVRYFVSVLVLQSSRWGRERWLLYFVCLPGVSGLLCGPSSRCHGFVCSLWLRYFLTILTYFIHYMLHCTPRTIFHGCQIVIWDPQNAKRRFPKRIWYGQWENAWFLWQPIADLRMGVCPLKYSYLSCYLS